MMPDAAGAQSGSISDAVNSSTGFAVCREGGAGEGAEMLVGNRVVRFIHSDDPLEGILGWCGRRGRWPVP